MTRADRPAPGHFSERGFHRWLMTGLPLVNRGPLPLGDDVAALPAGGERVALLTTDALSEGTHFRRTSPPELVGAAASAASLSDLAAKGGTPVALLLDLLLPPRTPESWARKVVRGAERCAAQYGAHLVGGDTKPARGRTVVGTMLGWGDRRYLAPRSGARPGDVLVTTGVVGRGGAIASRLSGPADGPGAAGVGFLGITPRVREGRILARRAHSMMDTSDGLAESAHLMAEASRRHLSIDLALLPLDPRWKGARARLLQRPVGIFYGGDYELFAAVSPRHVPLLTRRLARLGTPLTVIGSVSRGRGAALRIHGRSRRLPRAGWDPFRAAE